MLSIALGALMMAVCAGVLGFGELTSTSANVALVVFYVFLGMFVLSLVGMAAASAKPYRRMPSGIGLPGDL